MFTEKFVNLIAEAVTKQVTPVTCHAREIPMTSSQKVAKSRKDCAVSDPPAASIILANTLRYGIAHGSLGADGELLTVNGPKLTRTKRAAHCQFTEKCLSGSGWVESPLVQSDPVHAPERVFLMAVAFVLRESCSRMAHRSKARHTDRTSGR